VRRSSTRSLVLAGVASVAVLGVASPAVAHAELIKASPSPGTGLPQSAGAVVIRFTEPLNHKLSRIEVLASSGRDMGEGPTLPVEGDPRAMKRRLGLLQPGRYTVQWTTTSTVDGHTLHGSYSFGIGTSASPEQRLRAGPLDSEGLLGLVGRFVALVGLALWSGFVLLRGVGERENLLPTRLSTLGHAGSALALTGTVFSVVGSALASAGTPVAVIDVLSTSQSGRLRGAIVGTSALGVVVGPKRRSPFALLAGVALVAEAASGHSATTSRPVVAAALFALHMAVVGAWVFAIAASVAAGPGIRRALAVFSPYALAAAAAAALTGTINALFELADISDLFTTGYGRVLLVKTAAFSVMAVLGVNHFLARRKPEAGAGRLRRPARAELLAAGMALALATLLVGFPDPPRESEAATEELGGLDPVLATAEQRGALSVAEASGPFVVALTVAPPRPGVVDVGVSVLGVEAGDGLRNARLTGASEDGASMEADLADCGLGCFEGRTKISSRGAWRFSLSLLSNRGPVHVRVTAPMPTPDASHQLARTLRAMETLRSARMREDLSSKAGGTNVVSHYLFEAPQSFFFEVNDSKLIVIGNRRFRREDASWLRGSWPGPRFTWPEDYYRDFWHGRVATRLLGSARVDGAESSVIGFVRLDLPAWFRIWVGKSDGLVRREEMRAEGHIMDHIYSGLNKEVSIEPPK
jgi:copper transport protein